MRDPAMHGDVVHHKSRINSLSIPQKLNSGRAAPEYWRLFVDERVG
jgi:hypothetical protein